MYDTLKWQNGDLSMSGILWDWSKIIGVTIITVGLARNGYIDSIFAAVLMALYVMIRGAVRGSDGITKTIFWFLEISFILVLCANVLAKGGGIVSLVLLTITLFGETVGWIARLVMEGGINIYYGLFFIVAVLILKNIGIYIGNIKVHLAARTTFLIGLPVAALVVFASLHGGGNVWGLLGQLAPLFLLLVGFYIMAFGWSSSRRK